MGWGVLGTNWQSAGEGLCTILSSLTKLYMQGRPHLEGQRVFNIYLGFHLEAHIDHSYRTYVDRLCYLSLFQLGSPDYKGSNESRSNPYHGSGAGREELAYSQVVQESYPASGRVCSVPFPLNFLQGLTSSRVPWPVRCGCVGFECMCV